MSWRREDGRTAPLRAAIERRARRHLPQLARRFIQLATGVGGRRSYAARWLLFPMLRHISPAVMVHDGPIRLLVWTRDQVIPRRLYADRRGDSVQLAQALDVVTAGVEIPSRAIFVDVGANIGNAGLAALASGRFARVVALEPDPRSVTLLRANVGLNGASDRVEVVLAGASDVDDDHASVALNPRNYGDNVIVESAAPSPREGLVRPTRLVRLDSLLPTTAEWTDTDAFYWIDVQGHERRVLRGLGALLDAAIGVVVEISPEHAAPSDFAEIADRLARSHRWFARLGRDGGAIRSTDDLPAFVSGVVGSGDLADVVVFGRRAVSPANGTPV